MKGKRVELIVLTLTFFFFIGAVSSVISTPGKVVAQANDVYKNLEIFNDALSIIQRDYVEEVPTQDLIYGALKGMMNALDPHSQFLTPEFFKELEEETQGQFSGLGIEISLDERKILTVVAPLEGSPAHQVGIKAGDKIVKIEDKNTQGMTLLEAVKLLRGPNGTQVTMTVFRPAPSEEEEGKELVFTITRGTIHLKSVKAEVLEKNIGYLRLIEFRENSPQEVKEALQEIIKKGITSLILDLRNNPGGLLTAAVDVSDLFLAKGKLIVYAQDRDNRQNMKFYSKDGPTLPDIPMVVLINEGSASASEIVAGALRDHKRAVLLGVKTFGKGSVQSIIPLEDGSALRLTTAKYFTPSGAVIEAKGVEPDIEVLSSLELHAKLIKDAHTIGEVKEEAGAEKTGEEEEEAETDTQLMRAIQILQGYEVLRATHKEASTVQTVKAEDEHSQSP